MKKALLLASFLALAACTTPAYTMKNPKTGQIVMCGGNLSSSLAGGMIGYHIQKQTDNQCIQNFKDEGFQLESVREF